MAETAPKCSALFDFEFGVYFDLDFDFGYGLDFDRKFDYTFGFDYRVLDHAVGG